MGVARTYKSAKAAKGGFKKNSKGGKTKVTKVVTKTSVDQTKAGKKADKKRKALPAGKRITKSGYTYYERRANRAD